MKVQILQQEHKAEHQLKLCSNKRANDNWLYLILYSKKTYVLNNLSFAARQVL